MFLMVQLKKNLDVGILTRNSGMDDVEHHTMQLVMDRCTSQHSGHRTPHLSPGMSLSMQGSQVRRRVGAT